MSPFIWVSLLASANSKSLFPEYTWAHQSMAAHQHHRGRCPLLFRTFMCVHHLWMLLPNSHFALPRFVWTISIPFAKERCQIHSRKEAPTILFESCGVCEVNEKESGDKISLILSNSISSPLCKEAFLFNSFGLLHCIISLSFHLGGSLARKQSNWSFLVGPMCLGGAWESCAAFCRPQPIWCLWEWRYVCSRVGFRDLFLLGLALVFFFFFPPNPVGSLSPLLNETIRKSCRPPRPFWN